MKLRTLFSNKMWIIKAGIHRMLVRNANTEYPDKKQSDLGLHCLSCVRNFQTSTIVKYKSIQYIFVEPKFLEYRSIYKSMYFNF